MVNVIVNTFALQANFCHPNICFFFIVVNFFLMYKCGWMMMDVERRYNYEASKHYGNILSDQRVGFNLSCWRLRLLLPS